MTHIPFLYLSAPPSSLLLLGGRGGRRLLLVAFPASSLLHVAAATDASAFVHYLVTKLPLVHEASPSSDIARQASRTRRVFTDECE